MQATEILKQLVAVPSVNPMGRDLSGPEYFETALTQVLINLLRQAQVEPILQEVAPGRINLFAVYESEEATRTVLLDAHQDTVPVDGMTIPPFEPTVKDGRLYGRGACDVKGGLSAMLAAFLRLVAERPARSARTILSCTVDEESTSLGINALTKWLEEPDCPLPRPDLAIVAEPTELDVVVAHRGATRWTIRTSGRACHSSSPKDGISAIYRMRQVLERIEQYAASLESRPPHPRCGPPTCSVGRIGGGASVNTVPDECWIEIDRRVIPGEDSAAVIDEVRAELASLPFEVTHDPPWIIGAAPTGRHQRAGRGEVAGSDRPDSRTTSDGRRALRNSRLADCSDRNSLDRIRPRLDRPGAYRRRMDRSGAAGTVGGGLLSLLRAMRYHCRMGFLLGSQEGFNHT